MCFLDSGLVYVSLRGMKTTLFEQGGITYKKEPRWYDNDEPNWESRERSVKDGDVRRIDGELHYAYLVLCTFFPWSKATVIWKEVPKPAPTETPSKKARK